VLVEFFDEGDAGELSRSDECFVDYVEGFLETMIGKKCDASSRQCYSKRRTAKLKTPHAKTRA